LASEENKLAHSLADKDKSGSTKPLSIVAIVIFGLVVGLVVLSVLAGSYKVASVPLIIGAVIATFFAIRLCYRDTSWLLFALVLEEVVPYLNSISADPNARWVIRYPILLPLTIPAAWLAIKRGAFRRGYFLAYALFLGWCAITISYSEVPAISLGRLIPEVLVFAALLVVVESVKSASDVRRLFDRFLLACGFLLMIVAVSWISLPSDVTWIEEEGMRRFGGAFSTPNDLGAVCMVTIIAGIVQWNSTHGSKRLLLGICMAFAVLFGAMADSRTVFLALIVGIVAYSVWRYRAIGAIVAFAILCALFFFVWSFAPQYLNRDVTTATGRTEVWSFELVKIRQAPILGYGFSVEGQIFQDLHFPNWETFWNAGPNSSLHNSYLSLAISCGIPATIACLLILIWPWVSLMRSEKDPWNLKPLIFFILIPMLVLGTDESGLTEPRYVKGILFFLGWMLVERWRQMEDSTAAHRVVNSNAWWSHLVS
jgi:O-antigen ligase